MPQFNKIELFTDHDGRARFRESTIELDEGNAAAALSSLMPTAGMQLRQSPVGFRSTFHCTVTPQWLFIMRGQMEIGLQDGSSRIFKQGDHFFSNDTLPAGSSFDETVHGHWSRQIGDQVLETLFVRVP
jgi:hypothetical protein